MEHVSITWLTRPLTDLTKQQWEQLCDRCGLCCIHKIENQDGDIFLTDVACKYLDIQSVRCQCYHKRAHKQRLCRSLTPENIEENLNWLPDTCAYRRRFENRPLPSWHPLLSKKLNRVAQTGINIRDKVVSEKFVPETDWEMHIVDDDYFFRAY